MIDYLTARRQAGSPKGRAFAERLEAMPPEDAADEISDMLALCAPEDLAEEIECDFRLARPAAELIAAELRKRAKTQSRAFAERLEAMPPADAAAELFDSFGVCAEDLDDASADDFLAPQAAKLIAAELRKLWASREERE